MDPVILPEVAQVPGGFAFMPDQTEQILAAEDVAAIERQIEEAVAKVRAGVYRCPWGCGNPGFPAPKWKTEAGFRKHLATCSMRPAPEDFTRTTPPSVETSDADWERRHPGQDWAASVQSGRPVMVPLLSGEEVHCGDLVDVETGKPSGQDWAECQP